MKEIKLKSTGTFNRTAKKVKSELFSGNSFFDSCDLMQVKYEMLRAVAKEGCSISRCCAEFGLSRTAFYRAKAAYERNGLAGLTAERPGPRGPNKLNNEVLSSLLEYLRSNPDASPIKLQAFVKDRFNIDVHPRTIKRCMSNSKKNLREKRL